MEKLDLKKHYKEYYTATPEAREVYFKQAMYLSLCGKGDPSGSAFAKNVQALYSTAYTVKFSCKAMKRDFVVPKLEALWWFDETRFPGTDIATAPALVPREEWQYRLLLRLPDFVTGAVIDQAIRTVVELKGISEAEGVTLFRLEEKQCVQILHEGPFDQELQSLALLEQFMQQNRLTRNGLHHEIYLSDFRKTAPGKLKTILREPVKAL